MSRTSRSSHTSRSSRAGLIFPVGRCDRYLRHQTRGKFRIGATAPVYLAAVLEYMSAELLELAGNASTDNKRRRINARDIRVALGRDEELNRMYSHVIIPGGGIVPKDNVMHILSGPSKKAKIGAKKPSGSGKSKGKAKSKKVAKKTKPRLEKVIGTLKRAMSREDELALIQVLHQKKIGSHSLKVVQSDICDITTDAIVHPTNSTLSTGGQIGYALNSRAGGGLRAEINRWNSKNTPLATAGCCMTGAHGLRAKHVIHVHSPTWGPDDARKNLHNAVINIFKLAEEQNLTSIAFPSIGSGANSFPKHTAAAVILRAIQQHFENNAESSISEVYFVLYDQTSVSVYKHELINL